MLRSSATSHYNADRLGSITSFGSAAGSLSQIYTFDPFGKQTALTGSLVSPFQYTERESDSETRTGYACLDESSHPANSVFEESLR